MNLKKKNKAFFTMKRRANDGFTLVELIVVIAILAILGGVAIPVYNGYISKAHQAADDTLIAAINKAAATATLDAKGVDMDKVYTLYEGKPNNGGALMSDAVKGKTGISVEERFTQDGEVKNAFAMYFADNEDKCLQWYGSLKFDGEKFVGVESILNGALQGPDGVANAYKNSSFAHEDFGVPGMTGMVDTLAGALADYPQLNRVTDTSAYQKTLERLGIDDTTDPQTLANATVFYLADYVGQMDQDELWSHVKDNSLQTWLTGMEFDNGAVLTEDDATFFSTALRYAAATSYAYSGALDGSLIDIIEAANPTDNTSALQVVSDVTEKNPFAWDAYTDGKGAEDFNAFCQMLEIFGETNDGNFTSVEGSGYFSNAELQAQLNALLGVTTP